MGVGNAENKCWLTRSICRVSQHKSIVLANTFNLSCWPTQIGCVSQHNLNKLVVIVLFSSHVVEQDLGLMANTIGRELIPFVRRFVLNSSWQHWKLLVHPSYCHTLCNGVLANTRELCWPTQFWVVLPHTIWYEVEGAGICLVTLLMQMHTVINF